MGINVLRHGDFRVAQQFLGVFFVNPGVKKHGGIGVPELVRRDAGNCFVDNSIMTDPLFRFN